MYYIDPGTGSMLFTILIGVLSAGIYAFKNLIIKFRFYLSGGKQEKTSENRMPFVIFVDDKRYWNVFESVCDEFERREQSLTYMTASPDDPALNKEYKYITTEFIGEGNKAFAKLNMLKADILISTTPGLDVYQWKRSRDVKWYVHLLHAPNDVIAYKMFGFDYFDALLLSGEYQINQIRQLEKLRNLPAKELKVVGMTYMDQMKKRLDSYEKSENDKTTVLLAPSWTENGILSKYGSKMIDALLETGYHIIIRPHPQSFTSEKKMIDDLMKKYPNSDRLEWNRDNDNFDVLMRSDILISDFSGVIFDFSLVFDKPIIYADTSFDKAPLDACWLEEDLWTFSTLPKIGLQINNENLGDIKNLIDTCISSTEFYEGRKAAREETWQNIGNAAVTTVDYLLNKYQELNEHNEDDDN